MSTAPPTTEPLLVVFGYHDGRLPNPWFRAYKRAKRTIRLAGYHARVDLLPINALPPTVDVLATPPELAADAEAVSGVGERITSPPERVQAELDGLVARLVATGRLDRAPDQARSVAVHRGFMPLAERARLTE